jgi:hypothetical protein
MGILESPLQHRGVGLVLATLRIRATEENYSKHLQRMFKHLFQLYGSKEEWELTVTCNCVIQGNSRPTYSFFWGLDFGNADYSIQSEEMESHFVTVRSMGDVSQIPTRFTVDHFSEAFFAQNEGSDVSIHSIVNVCYLARRLLPNFVGDRKTVGKSLTTVW